MPDICAMKNIHHPSEILDADTITLIKGEAAAAERLEAMTPKLLELIYSRQWFRLLAPKAYNAPEMDLPEIVRLEEAIAWCDGSTGWVVTLCAGASWFGGFISPKAATIFNDVQVCLGGSGAATGTAEITADGFLVNGKWLHATGSPHVTVFTANCVITKNKIPVKDDSGNELIKPFFFLNDEVTRIHTWTSVGMVATASNAYEVKNLAVPTERCFSLKTEDAVIPSNLYKYPFLQLAEATLAANISGMALHFLEEALELVKYKNERQQLIALPAISNAINTLTNNRASFYTQLDASWEELNINGCITEKTLAALSTVSRKLANEAIQLTDRCFPYCGLAAASKETVINRTWRDIHTASQHSLLAYPVL